MTICAASARAVSPMAGKLAAPDWLGVCAHICHRLGLAKLTKIGNRCSRRVKLRTIAVTGMATDRIHAHGLTSELLDAIPYGIVVVDGQRVVDANRATADLLWNL